MGKGEIMSKYSRQQEQRMWKYLQDHPDVRNITYFGSRELNKGDFLFWLGQYPGKQIRIDHKSTTNEIQIKIQKGWLEKLLGECIQQQDRVGMSLPIITFGLKKCRTFYTLSYSQYKPVSLYKAGDKSCVVRYRELNKWIKEGIGGIGGGSIAIDFGKTVYIHTLDGLLEAKLQST